MDKVLLTKAIVGLVGNATNRGSGGCNHIINTDTVLRNSEEILVRLKFLSYIQPGDKVDVTNLKILPNTLLTRLYRTFIQQEDRKSTIQFVKDVVSRVFEILDYLTLSDGDFDRLVSRNAIADLLAAKEGLVNLKSTYDTDKMFKCSIDAIVQSIEVKLIELSRKLNLELESFAADRREIEKADRREIDRRDANETREIDPFSTDKNV